MTTIKEITPSELAKRIKQQDKLFLLDVREPNEVAICAIDGAIPIPMNLIPIYLDKIPDEIDIIIYCHHGVRSLNVAYFLAENGFDVEQLYNLSGGIDRWSLSVEPSMCRY